jgi:hypothetical protein
MAASGGDMCVSMLRSLTCVHNSVGTHVFLPFFENVVGPAVQRIAAAVVTDGDSEYFEEDGAWDGFASNFMEFLESVLLHANTQVTEILVRHDVLSCIMRLLSVRLFGCLFFPYISICFQSLHLCNI